MLCTQEPVDLMNECKVYVPTMCAWKKFTLVTDAAKKKTEKFLFLQKQLYRNNS